MCRLPVTLGGGMTMQYGGLADSGMRLERAALLPFRVEAGFDLLGVVGLVEHCWPYNEKRHGFGPVALVEGSGAWGQRRVSRTISRST